MKTKAEYLRTLRAKRKALGICRNCKAPSVPGRVSCARHLAESRALSEEDKLTKKLAHIRLIERREAQGLCRECERPQAKGYVHCQVHVEKGRADGAMCRAKKRAKHEQAAA
jgi:hypothetical protein